MKMKQQIVGLVTAVILYSCEHKADTTKYYFDPLVGRNENEGTSPRRPLRDLAKISTLHLKPGDSILLKSGAVFEEHVYISCKGDSAKPIVIGKYGGDIKP